MFEPVRHPGQVPGLPSTVPSIRKGGRGHRLDRIVGDRAVRATAEEGVDHLLVPLDREELGLLDGGIPDLARASTVLVERVVASENQCAPMRGLGCAAMSVTGTRVHLRTAQDVLTAVAVEAFAERSQRDLLAKSEKVRKRLAETATSPPHTAPSHHR